MSQSTGRRLGVAVVGLGGAVATTAAAGVALLRAGAASHDGLPMAGWTIDGKDGKKFTLEELGVAGYTDIIMRGWDLDGRDLHAAAELHGVLDHKQLLAAQPELSQVKPWKAAGDKKFCTLHGDNTVLAESKEERVAMLRADLQRFRAEHKLDGMVVMNLASTEATPDPSTPCLQTLEAFEAGIKANDPAIGPAMLYGYAALLENAAYGNFTPSLACDIPALRDLAISKSLPLAGKDGKTGQTMMKTVLAPAFRSRALRVDGWYSTNILGNRDGEALHDPKSNASKIGTKGTCLDACLGYKVDDHVVKIDYYRPRGDAKEAWDNIDLIGFLGQKMQLKVNFLCRDSVLAAPLVLEIARLLDLCHQQKMGGAAEVLGSFFKAPMTKVIGAVPVHPLHEQETILRQWLESIAQK